MKCFFDVRFLVQEFEDPFKGDPRTLNAKIEAHNILNRTDKSTLISRKGNQSAKRHLPVDYQMAAIEQHDHTA
jgi:hypothetical protein